MAAARSTFLAPSISVEPSIPVFSNTRIALAEALNSTRKRYQLKKDCQGKQHDPHHHQCSERHDKPQDKDRPCCSGSEVCQRHQGTPKHQRAILLLVLDRVAALMGGYTDGCHRPGSIGAVR